VSIFPNKWSSQTFYHTIRDHSTTSGTVGPIQSILREHTPLQPNLNRRFNKRDDSNRHLQPCVVVREGVREKNMSPSNKMKPINSFFRWEMTRMSSQSLKLSPLGCQSFREQAHFCTYMVVEKLLGAILRFTHVWRVYRFVLKKSKS